MQIRINQANIITYMNMSWDISMVILILVDMLSLYIGDLELRQHN